MQIAEQTNERIGKLFATTQRAGSVGILLRVTCYLSLYKEIVYISTLKENSWTLSRNLLKVTSNFYDTLYSTV
jgi:hypothetical protein